MKPSNDTLGAPIPALPLLGITEKNVGSCSVRLNKILPQLNPFSLPREALYDHLFGHRWSDKEKNRRYHIRGERVLQFLQLEQGSSQYLFMGCFSMAGMGVKRGHDGPLDLVYDWRGHEDESLAPFVGRLVISYKRSQGYTGMDFDLSKPKNAESFLERAVVHSVRPTPLRVRPFPGYDQVRLSHPELVAAVQDGEWKVALGNVQGVYLQTDLSNGWHYVGAAYSKAGERTGLLSRLTEYAFGDHTGGNLQLKQIPGAASHIERYFQYSILEVFDMKADARTIVEREHWWMQTLGSVRHLDDPYPHGYNTL